MRKYSKALYMYTIMYGAVCIIDLKMGGVTVADDLDAVIADIIEDEGPLDGMPIVYECSDGLYDGVVFNFGQTRTITDEHGQKQTMRTIERIERIKLECTTKKLAILAYKLWETQQIISKHIGGAEPTQPP